MKIVLYGASGNAGSRILRELQARGHDVTGAVHPLVRLLVLVAGLGGQRQDREGLLLPGGEVLGVLADETLQLEIISYVELGRF